MTGSVAFCVSARTGIGHLRRVTNIAAAIRLAAPNTRIELLSNASIEGLSQAEQSLFSRTCVVARPAMARILADTKPDAVAVDTAVIPDLELLSQPLALILRETVPHRLAAFRLPGDRLWDEVIVAEPPTVWTLDPDQIGARRATNAGWIYRTTEHAHAVLEPRPGARTVLIATGGGGTTASLVHEIGEIVRMVRERSRVPLRIVQALGPRATPSAVIPDVDEIVDVGANLDRAFAEADVVISTSGYNSILELAATTTPALLCSIARTYDDQTARATTWASSMGLAHETGRGERSANWIADLLATGRRRPKAHLSPSGSDRAARLLIDLVRDSRDLERRVFIKPASSIDPRTLDARARALLSAGIPTPQSLSDSATDRVSFVHLQGPTAADDWMDAQAVQSSATTSNLVALADAVTAPLAALHAASAQGAISQDAQLIRLDPWRRIMPRLAVPAPVSAGRNGPQRLRAGQLASELRNIHDRLTPKPAVDTIVHGDYHLGQLIRPIGRDGYVIVDLDDLAIGPREHDIGNCIAHIATSPRLWPHRTQEALVRISPLFIAAYNGHSAVALDSAQIDLHCAIGMLRRALKLAERGDHARVADILEAAELLCLSLGARVLRMLPHNSTHGLPPTAISTQASD